MGQFGHELRREREARGIALDSITSVTKISERHLVALEEERFDALPGGVLSKGIVRGYVRAVGLDEDAWISRYLSAYHQSGQIKDDDVAWMEFAENVGRARKGEDAKPAQGMRWFGVAVLLSLLALFCWYVARFVSDRALAGQLGAARPVAIRPIRHARLAPRAGQPAALAVRHAGE
jgi:cytoskeletal protein RodZ